MALQVAMWISGAALAAALAAGSSAGAAPSFPVTAAGDWSGTLGATGRHVFLHIHKTTVGRFVGVMDSPDRGEGGLAIRPLAAADGGLAFAAGGAEFHGAWDSARGQWSGTWTEANSSWPVSFRQDIDDSMPRLGGSTSQRLILRKPD